MLVCGQVDVTDVKTGQTWYFDCNQWFDKTMGDGLTERVLRATLQVSCGQVGVRPVLYGLQW